MAANDFSMLYGPSAGLSSGLGAGATDVAGVARAGSIRPAGFGGWLKGLMGGAMGEIDPVTGVEKPGWGGLALDTAQALGGAWMGMKQYGMAKDQLKFQKQAFNKNYEAQKTSMNTQLEDRQRARVASSPTAYESVDPYMKKAGIR